MQHPTCWQQLQVLTHSPWRRKLASSYPKLVHFEICVLANLAPGDAEEAKLMVPSLMVRPAPPGDLLRCTV